MPLPFNTLHRRSYLKHAFPQQTTHTIHYRPNEAASTAKRANSQSASANRKMTSNTDTRFNPHGYLANQDHGSLVTDEQVDRFATYLFGTAKKFASSYAKSKLGPIGAYAVDNYWPWDRQHVPKPAPPKGQMYAPGLHTDFHVNEEHIMEQHKRYKAKKPHKKGKQDRDIPYTLYRGNLNINPAKETDNSHYPGARPIVHHAIAELTEIAAHILANNGIDKIIIS